MSIELTVIAAYLVGMVIFCVVFFPLNARFKWITKDCAITDAIVIVVLVWPLATLIGLVTGINEAIKRCLPD